MHNSWPPPPLPWQDERQEGSSVEEPAGGNELPKLCQPLSSSFIPAAHSALQSLLWPKTISSLRIHNHASAEKHLQPVCRYCGAQGGRDSREKTRRRVTGVTVCFSLPSRYSFGTRERRNPSSSTRGRRDSRTQTWRFDCSSSCSSCNSVNKASFADIYRADGTAV